MSLLINKVFDCLVLITFEQVPLFVDEASEAFLYKDTSSKGFHFFQFVTFFCVFSQHLSYN